ncbi:MAG TPA: energy transducer TonB, partial [Acidobacteriaceae bacterium]
MGAWARTLGLSAAVAIAGFTAAANNLELQHEDPGPELVQVFTQSSDVTAPELLPPTNPLVVPDNCKGKIKSEIRFSTIIDLQGAPRNITFLSATGNDLDKFALLMLDRERFKPATRNNRPVAVAQAVNIKLEICHTDSTTVDGAPATFLHLRSKPELTLTPLPDPPKQVILGATVDQNLARNYQSAHFDQVGQQKYGSKITEPKLLLYTEAKFSDEARRKSIEGTCI